MLPSRLERILTGLHEHDQKASADAILSLKVTSARTGAFSTEVCCLELEMLVRENRFDLAAVTAERLVSEVTVLCNFAPDVMLEARRALIDE
ncbi:hypothetical protein [Arthrobacter sp. UYEF21]|uniref:hypothetical protein n=1 Tax=Arthrobacter sp. UYEF21 TaxID=1756364 RepID=UPI003391EC4C